MSTSLAAWSLLAPALLPGVAGDFHLFNLFHTGSWSSAGKPEVHKPPRAKPDGHKPLPGPKPTPSSSIGANCSLLSGTHGCSCAVGVRKSQQTLTAEFAAWRSARATNVSFTSLQASRAVMGDVGPIRESLRRAEQTGRLRIVVFGGSVTAGHECTPSKDGHNNVADLACAWPGQLPDVLQLPRVRLDVLNLAHGGTDSMTAIRLIVHRAWQYHRPEGWEPDVLINSCNVNDQVISPDAAAFLSRMEAWVRRAQATAPLVLVVDDFSPDPLRPSALLEVRTAQEMKAMVASYYGVRLISTRDVLWPHVARECAPRGTCAEAPSIGRSPRSRGAPSIHITRHQHRLVALLLAWNVYKEYEELCQCLLHLQQPRAGTAGDAHPCVPPPVPSAKPILWLPPPDSFADPASTLAACPHFLSLFESFGTVKLSRQKSGLPAVCKGWLYYSDIGSKYGWVATRGVPRDAHGSPVDHRTKSIDATTSMCRPWTLSSDVVIVWPNVHVHSMLQVAYTSSYTPLWGSVQVELIPKALTNATSSPTSPSSNRPRPIILGVINARDTTSNVSVTQMATWSNLTAGNYSLRLTLLSGVDTRFKVTGWFSC